MATQAMQIFRETALPAQASLVPYAWYVIAPSANPNHIEVYVTDSTPAPSTIARRIPTTSDIQSMIDASMAAASAQDVFVVADIAARDALSPASPVLAHVVDASGDGTVDAGGATYIYDSGNTVWIKTAEWESQDISVAWGDITGGPASTPAQIDAAVASAHSHSNKTQLDNIGQDANGDLTYNGSLPHTGWDSTGW